jgi:hypothetical protein
LRQNEQDRDKLLAPVQEINHLLEELEKKQQRLNQLREPPAHPTTH